MSYSFSAASVTAETAETQLRAAANATKSANANQPNAEATQEAINTAIASVLGLIKSGVLGTLPVNVSVGGHANPGHIPISGWSSETMSISIFQVT